MSHSVRRALRSLAALPVSPSPRLSLGLSLRPALRVTFAPALASAFAFALAFALVLMPAALAAQSGDPIGTLGEDGSGAEARVHRALNDFHRAAATADSIAYFGAFTADGVFLGTDATERWTVEEFKGYARGSFSRGRGWTYVPTERWVTVSADGNTAWFDERLTNASYGETRGSGALVLEGGTWKVAQYNLTIPIPNALAREFAQRIRELSGG